MKQATPSPGQRPSLSHAAFRQKKNHAPAQFSGHNLLLILAEDYWYFRLRPQEIIEIVCGEGSLQFVTTLPKNANKEIVLELLAAVLPPPNLQFLILMWLNGVELRNRLVGIDNGFYLRIEVTGNHRLGSEILLTPHRLFSTLHEAPPANIHRHNSECYCFLLGRAFFLGCRCLIVQGEKKACYSPKSTVAAQTSEGTLYVLNQCTLLSVTSNLSSTETDTRWWRFS